MASSQNILLCGNVEASVKDKIAAALQKIPVKVSIHPEAKVSKQDMITAVCQKAFIVTIQQQMDLDSFAHYRVLWVDGMTTVEEITEDILKHTAPTFVSTRSNTSKGDGSSASFLQVVREGLAADGGLYLPRALPQLPPSLLYYVSCCTTDYVETAQLILERLVDLNELPAGVLTHYLRAAYDLQRWACPSICPLRELDAQTFVMELFHGPTAAFKDFALQLFPYIFSLAVLEEESRYLILAATSGDTGVAVIEGFRLAQVGNVSVAVMYPLHGVSPVQKLQMVSADGSTVHVIGVESDFDFCQGVAKFAFSDGDTKTTLQKKSQTVLSSANSINWARLIPQIVYYFFSYGQLVRGGKVKYGDPVDFAVPTGNFGNILSGFIAKQMGLPIRRLVLASNRNDVLYEFISTGVYDICSKQLVPTISPSIDILKASNIERFLYLASNRDGELVSSLMTSLQNTGRFEATEGVKAVLKNHFWAGKCDEGECFASIASTYEKTHQGFIPDPHTAVALHVVEKYKKHLEKEKEVVVPIVVASTAHWAKFPRPILQALKIPHGEVKENADVLEVSKTVQDWYKIICSQCKGEKVAVPLEKMVAAAVSATEAIPERVSKPDTKEILSHVFKFVEQCQASNVPLSSVTVA